MRKSLNALDNNGVFSLKYTHLKDMENGKKLIIDSDTGSWAFISKEYFPLLKLVDGKHVGKKIVSYFSDKVKADEVLEMLWNSGILAVSGKTVVQKDNFQYDCIPRYTILNVTHDCNFRCGYCYANGGISSEYMSPEIMERIALEVSKLPTKDMVIEFHGGEPLVDFKKLVSGYKRIENLKINKKIEFHIQTNATLINEEIADFLRKEDIKVGISLDGFLKYNDLNRFYKNGRGTFNDIMKGISILRNKNVDFGIMVVLTKNNIKKISEILDFFIEEEFISFNISDFFQGGRGCKNSHLSIHSEELFNAFKTVYKKIDEYNSNVRQKPKLEEFNITHILKNIIFGESQCMCHSSPCGAGISTLGYDVDGDVYVCKRLVGVTEFKLGNIMGTSLREILRNNKVIERFRNRNVNNIEECSKCEWKYFCCGDCPSKIYGVYGIIEHKALFCDYYKKMVSYFMDLISKDMLKVENFVLE